MRRYETVFILRPDLGEAQTKDTIRRFEGLIASGGGEIVETDEWGMRELAYQIKGERRGYYVRLDYVAAGTVTNEVERNLKIADGVVRYLSVMVDDNADAAAARAEVEAHRARRAAALQAKAAPEATAAGAPGEVMAEVPDAPEEIMAEAAAETVPSVAAATLPPGEPPASESGGQSD